MHATTTTCCGIRVGGAVEGVGLRLAIHRPAPARRVAGLGAAGFEVLQHRGVPPDDGGLAFAQAAVAAHRLAREGVG